MDDAAGRWLPPSPHREHVLDMVARGRAHVEFRGHGLPPLLVHEDGGSMELHRCRWVDGDLIADGGSNAAAGVTRFRDVCGTIDAIREILTAEARAPDDNGSVASLVDDALYMVNRMAGRTREYREFADSLARIAEQMRQIDMPDVRDAEGAAGEIRAELSAAGDGVSLPRESLISDAERIRDVAESLEAVLYPMRDLCREVIGRCDEIRGGRAWPPFESEKGSDS